MSEPFTLKDLSDDFAIQDAITRVMCWFIDYDYYMAKQKQAKPKQTIKTPKGVMKPKKIGQKSIKAPRY